MNTHAPTFSTKVERMNQPNPHAHATRVMIVDDHPIVREGYKRLIEGEEGLEVCGEAEDMPHAIRVIHDLHPDLVIVDMTLKNGSGLELIKEVKAMYPDIKMLVASMHDETLFAERALRAGAMGYVNKQEATKQLA